jgi:hypothetical protein
MLDEVKGYFDTIDNTIKNNFQYTIGDKVNDLDMKVKGMLSKALSTRPPVYKQGISKDVAESQAIGDDLNHERLMYISGKIRHAKKKIDVLIYTRILQMIQQNPSGGPINYDEIMSEIDALDEKLKLMLLDQLRAYGPNIRSQNFKQSYSDNLIAVRDNQWAVDRLKKKRDQIGVSVMDPAVDYRNNYWVPPYEIPQEPYYYPGYNVVDYQTPPVGYYWPQR